MLEQGIHFDVPSGTYFEDPCKAPSLTQSIAKILIDQSPLHAWHAHPRLGGKVDPVEDYEPAKAIGNAAHKLMIGRGKDIMVLEFDNFRTKDAQTIRDDAMASGKVPILQKHFARARRMVDVARERVPFDEPGVGEVVIIWQEDGLWFRSMIDWLPHNMRSPSDFKTTGMSVAPHVIPSLMMNGGWDVQAAMHERGLDVLDPNNAGRRKFRFIAQENYEPYALTICELPEAVLTMGRKKLQHAIDVWRGCMAVDRWPGYPNETVYPTYPGWAESQWLIREIHEAAQKRSPIAPDHMMAG